MFVDSRPRGARVVVAGRFVGHTPLSVPELAPGNHSVRFELPGFSPVTSTVTIKPGAQSATGRDIEMTSGSFYASKTTPDVLNIYGRDPRTRERNLVPRPRRGRRGRDRRRSRVQHEHDRLSGSPDRSLVRRTDRHDDESGDRQLRRDAGRRRVARACRSPGSSSATRRRSRATGGPRTRCTTTSRVTASSRSPTSTRARSRACCASPGSCAA